MQVWWGRLGDARPGLLGLLDPVERARHESTADPAGRGRFLVGCALSRLVLGELLGLSPADVPLRRVCPRCGGPHGKVHLAPPDSLPNDLPNGFPDGPWGAISGPASSSAPGFAPGAPSGSTPGAPSGSTAGSPPASTAGFPSAYGFSVTHSGAVVGVAVCRGGEVGLDVEESHGDVDVDSAARVALSDSELAALYARPPGERQSAFLRTWTRKEAVLKALGVGLAAPLRGLEVSAPDRPPAVLAWPARLAAPPGMGMADLVVDGVHPAAVAVVPAVAGATGGEAGGVRGKAGGVRVTLHDGSALLAAYDR